MTAGAGENRIAKMILTAAPGAEYPAPRIDNGTQGVPLAAMAAPGSQRIPAQSTANEASDEDTLMLRALNPT